ncbi:response regulator transcription factor [Aliifodinibius sp. S!AR15-10]|uniref:response regulator transcription factor n=1 Tax=Aliifodinibius sp. S!AR15-10 TaxID=2950437 RepID=UPI0028618C6A|nr:response regulator transcription factor [Aliifodinibius sp. S!AR15-10]MDR8393252.1 response regulator transcription factor [Aliifodinibius sp. S!AR15-10]
MASGYKKKIVIVDDHPMMRKGLAQTLDNELEFDVVAQFDKAEEAIQKFDELEPDLMIVDVSLPGMSGLELVKHLTARDGDVKILVVSRHDETLYAERVIRAGAKGYVMKLEAGEVLLKAVRKIMNGGIYVSSEVSEKLLMGMARGQKDMTESPIDLLSDRELEVFELTGKGNSTREIAKKLHLSIKTVESYRARIKTKLNLENATELMVHAVKWVENEDAELG